MNRPVREILLIDCGLMGAPDALDVMAVDTVARQGRDRDIEVVDVAVGEHADRGPSRKGIGELAGSVIIA